MNMNRVETKYETQYVRVKFQHFSVTVDNIKTNKPSSDEWKNRIPH